MTRDEHIAQLKPGMDVSVIGFVEGQCKFLRHVAGQVELLVRQWQSTNHVTGWVDGGALIFPPHLPPPKATPGKVYRRSGCSGVGLIDGRVFVPIYECEPFDPAVWTPLDGEESK